MARAEIHWQDTGRAGRRQRPLHGCASLCVAQYGTETGRVWGREVLGQSRFIECYNVNMRLFKQGNTAEIYEYSDGKILKLFRADMPAEAVRQEFKKTQEIYQDIKNIPQAYELLNHQGRQGIVYERIDGIDMIKVMLRNLSKIKVYSQKLAQIHRDLHTQKVKLDYTAKTKLTEDIEAVPDLSIAEKSQIIKYLHTLPDGKSLLHFDFHPGNILLRNNESVVIDWMTACVGDPCADVVRTCLLLEYGELAHTNMVICKVARVLENYIGKQYLKEYQTLSSISKDDIKKWFLPVAAGRLRERITPHEKQNLLKSVKSLLAHHLYEN